MSPAVAVIMTSEVNKIVLLEKKWVEFYVLVFSHTVRSKTSLAFVHSAITCMYLKDLTRAAVTNTCSPVTWIPLQPCALCAFM